MSEQGSLGLDFLPEIAYQFEKRGKENGLNLELAKKVRELTTTFSDELPLDSLIYFDEKTKAKDKRLKILRKRANRYGKNDSMLDGANNKVFLDISAREEYLKNLPPTSEEWSEFMKVMNNYQRGQLTKAIRHTRGSTLGDLRNIGIPTNSPYDAPGHTDKAPIFLILAFGER
jgi:hypothetical protein